MVVVVVGLGVVAGLCAADPIDVDPLVVAVEPDEPRLMRSEAVAGGTVMLVSGVRALPELSVGWVTRVGPDGDVVLVLDRRMTDEAG